MKSKNRLILRVAAVVGIILGGTLLAHIAVADDDDEIFRASNPVWKEECGSCHVAYPPRLLPASSWRTIMANLENHFDSDASLDAGTTAEISDFLQQNAGRERRSNKSVLRITELGWFRHEHEEELPASIWNHPKVKSPANCEACHTRAADGDYRERSLRVPR